MFNKSLTIKVFTVAILAAAALMTNAQQINPLTKAVLNGYGQLLSENPKDYTTLYQRASQYYNLSMYDEALVDIIKALDYTPSKEKELRCDEFSLLADIYIQTKEYDKALTAINNVLALSPDDYAMLYKKGNIELYLKNPEDAYKTFATMQRMKSRSQEAFFGMARADIMMDKKEEARELISQAENADPSNYLTFCRIGELYEEMGEDETAAANYLSAFSLADTKTSRPLESLISLAGRNYNAVEAAIQYAISRSANSTPLYFLQANIALNSGNYQQAYVGFSELLKSKEAQTGAVYANMARTCLALDKISEASTNADLAVLKDNTTSNQLVKARVELAAGNPAAALLAATKALRVNASSSEALKMSALANISMGDGKAALEQLNEAVMTDPADIDAKMLRAYVNFDMLNDAKEAILEYTRIGNSEEDTFKGITYKALAQCLAGKKLDADETMKRALRDKENKTKDDYFLAAIYYAQTGDLSKGKEMVERAIASGYQNVYELYSDKTANLNIAPLRHLLPAR